jgi:hypothetical protein
MLAKGCVVFRAKTLCGFGNRSSSPPAADGTSDSADQRTYGSRRRANARSEQHAGDTARCLADLVAETRLTPVIAQGRVLGALESSVY